MAMLSSVLNSPRAIQVNIQIMRIFVKLRQLIAEKKDMARRLEELEKEGRIQDGKIQAVFDAIRELIKNRKNPKGGSGFWKKNLRPIGPVEGDAGQPTVVKLRFSPAAWKRPTTGGGIRLGDYLWALPARPRKPKPAPKTTPSTRSAGRCGWGRREGGGWAWKTRFKYRSHLYTTRWDELLPFKRKRWREGNGGVG